MKWIAIIIEIPKENFYECELTIPWELTIIRSIYTSSHFVVLIQNSSSQRLKMTMHKDTEPREILIRKEVVTASLNLETTEESTQHQGRFHHIQGINSFGFCV